MSVGSETGGAEHEIRIRGARGSAQSKLAQQHFRSDLFLGAARDDEEDEDDDGASKPSPAP